MKVLVPASAVCLLLAAPMPSIAVDGRPSDSLERPFKAGGRVKLDLSAGDYRIVAGEGDALRVDWTTRDERSLRRVRVSADVDGDRATIRTRGSRNHFRVWIHLPQRTDLDVHLTAGELRVEGIEGNKGIDLNAGEIEVDMGPPDDYARIEASVWAGEIRVPALGLSKEGLFRSIDWRGKGRYTLTADLLAGEVKLRSK